MSDYIQPPIKLYPMHPPALVAGAAIDGNKEVTARGKTFLVTVINLLNASTKLFTPEDDLPWDGSTWPGLKTEEAQNEWQSIGYIGEEKKPRNWGDLSAVDYNFDGVADAGKTIDDAVTASSSAVDYSGMFAAVNGALSGDESFGQALENGTEPLSGARAFAFLIGLIEAKRRWVDGLQGLGIDAADLNRDGAAQAFNDAFSGLNIQEAGALNIQILLNYLGMRTAVAEKYNALAGESAISTDLLNGAKQYYASIAPRVDLTEVQQRGAEFSARLNGLKNMLDGDGKLDPPSADLADAYRQEFLQYADQVGALLTDIENRYRGVNRQMGAGLIVGGTDELGQLAAAYRTALAGADPSRTNFADEINRLTAIGGKLDKLSTACADPTAAVQMLFDELAQPLSTEALGTDLATAIKGGFLDALSKPVGEVVSMLGTNNVFRAINRYKQSEYEQKKEDKYLQDRDVAKAEGKHRNQLKAEEAQVEKKAAEQAAANKQASAKETDRPRPRAKKGA
jgi:hypothetical protein